MNGKLKISFSDFWPGFDSKNNFWTVILDNIKVDYEVVSDNSDLLITSCFGSSFLTKKATKKFFWLGENFRVDNKLQPINKSLIEIFDYVYSFDYNDYENHYRLPLYLIDTIESNIDDYNSILRNKTKDELYKEFKDRKFCTFVQTNPNCQFRNVYYLSLNNISKVDSYGPLFNNTGRKIDRKEKIEISKEYKFQLAFENSEYDGYVSEKIIDAFKSDIIPIYWGGSLVSEEFNAKSFIDVNKLGFDPSLKLVSDMKSDFELYWEYYNQPIISDSQPSIKSRIENFYNNFSQNLNF
jgi:hypothetical protein